MLSTKLGNRSLALIALTATALFASPAFATTLHTDVSTGGFDYTNIEETSTFGDPEPLFGQPIGSGGALVFNPPNFTATSSGGGVDQTGALLSVDVSFDALTPILSLEIQEFGDYLLLGAGTGATGTFVGIAGDVVVLDTISGNDIGTIIPFVGTVTPPFTTLPADGPLGLWEANAFIDIFSVVGDATSVRLLLDNDLTAASEPGTTAKVQKKVSNGITVIPTPEPNTMMLIGGGLVLTLLGTRERGGSLS